MLKSNLYFRIALVSSLSLNFSKRRIFNPNIQTLCIFHYAMFHGELLSKLANSYFVFVQWTIIGIFGRSLSYRLYLISPTLNSSYTYRNFSSLLQPIFIQLAHIVILLRRCCIQDVPWEIWVYGRECIFNKNCGDMICKPREYLSGSKYYCRSMFQ